MTYGRGVCQRVCSAAALGSYQLFLPFAPTLFARSGFLLARAELALTTCASNAVDLVAGEVRRGKAQQMARHDAKRRGRVSCRVMSCRILSCVTGKSNTYGGLTKRACPVALCLYLCSSKILTLKHDFHMTASPTCFPRSAVRSRSCSPCFRYVCLSFRVLHLTKEPAAWSQQRQAAKSREARVSNIMLCYIMLTIL